MISNPNNPTIRQIRKLRKRRERERRRQMIVEGHRALGVALGSKADVSRVLHTRSATRNRGDLLHMAKERGAAVLEVSREVMSVLTSVATAPDVLGIVSIPECTLSDAVAKFGLGAVLAGVRDPATAGSILSSCAAAGGTAAIATLGTTDLFAPKSVRSAAGAHFLLAIAFGVSPDDCVATLRKAGVRMIAIDRVAVGSRKEPPPGGPVAVIIGEESTVPAALADAADEHVRAGSGDSLIRPSVAAEAAVVLFEAARRRGPAAVGEG